VRARAYTRIRVHFLRDRRELNGRDSSDCSRNIGTMIDRSSLRPLRDDVVLFSTHFLKVPISLVHLAKAKDGKPRINYARDTGRTTRTTGARNLDERADKEARLGKSNRFYAMLEL